MDVLAVAPIATPVGLAASIVAIGAATGAAFAVFKANAAKTLIDLLKDNVEQLEVSRDEFKAHAEVVAQDLVRVTAQYKRENEECLARADDAEVRIGMLERLVTGVDAIKVLDDKLMDHRVQLGETMRDQHTEIMRALDSLRHQRQAEGG